MAEVLASLFILSLSTLALAEIIQSASNNWDKTNTALTTIAENRTLLQSIPSNEAQLKTDNWTQKGPTLRVDNGPDLYLSSPKITQSPDCLYDLVGRKCR